MKTRYGLERGAAIHRFGSVQDLRAWIWKGPTQRESVKASDPRVRDAIRRDRENLPALHPIIEH